MNRIPKIIHYCWFGYNEKSELIKKCIKSWKKMCPDYKIVEWNEDNFNINTNNYVKEAYSCGKWAFVSDYVRLWATYNYGGIYLDTDVELINSLDSLLDYDAFFSSENDEFIATGLGFGAKKNNYLIKKMLEEYNNIHFAVDGHYDLTPCPVRNTISIKESLVNFDKIDKLIVYNNIAIFPKEYFCPFDYDSHKLQITNNTLSIHWYGESWLSPWQKFIKRIKRLVFNIIGKKNYMYIKSILKHK